MENPEVHSVEESQVEAAQVVHLPAHRGYPSTLHLHHSRNPQQEDLGSLSPRTFVEWEKFWQKNSHADVTYDVIG